MGKAKELEAPRARRKSAARGTPQAAPRAVQPAHGAGVGPGCEARPGRQGAPQHRAREDGAGRADPRQGSQVMSEQQQAQAQSKTASRSRCPAHADRHGRQHQDDQDRVGQIGRAPGQARALQQVHPPHDQAPRSRRRLGVRRKATSSTSPNAAACRPARPGRSCASSSAPSGV